VNGDQFYEVEFVPEYSRVLYYFNDNRWIYVDSTANDTTFTGAIVFGGNAPDGMKLVRFYVDMSNETVNPSGVHLTGSFQGWNPASTIMYSFGNNIYEIIAHVPDGVYEYKFLNGNTTGNGEAVPGGCAVNGNREINVVDDVLLNMVCFASCDPCITGIADQMFAARPRLTPNPASDHAVVSFGKNGSAASVRVTDIAGKIVREYRNVSGESLIIERGDLQPGVYVVSVAGMPGSLTASKLLFE
jgi:hypothetical protein